MATIETIHKFFRCYIDSLLSQLIISYPWNYSINSSHDRYLYWGYLGIGYTVVFIMELINYADFIIAAIAVARDSRAVSQPMATFIVAIDVFDNPRSVYRLLNTSSPRIFQSHRYLFDSITVFPQLDVCSHQRLVSKFPFLPW